MAKLRAIEGGKAAFPRPPACPRCGRAHAPPRPWRERAAERLEDGALVSCWLAFGALPIGTVYLLSRLPVSPWSLLALAPLAVGASWLGGAVLGLAVRTHRRVLERQAVAARREVAL